MELICQRKDHDRIKVLCTTPRAPSVPSHRPTLLMRHTSEEGGKEDRASLLRFNPKNNSIQEAGTCAHPRSVISCDTLGILLKPVGATISSSVILLV